MPHDEDPCQDKGSSKPGEQIKQLEQELRRRAEEAELARLLGKRGK